MDALKRMRGQVSGDKPFKKGVKEMSSLFSSKRRRVETRCVWKHRFVCLAYRDQEKIPTTDIEKDDLYEAGLGEKEVEFGSLDMSGDVFRDLLYREFPKLMDAGGFQLCKCIPNSRKLEPLSKLVHTSPTILKQRVGTARTYIRPIQRDLDLSALVVLPHGVSSKLSAVCGLSHESIGAASIISPERDVCHVGLVYP